MSVYRVKPEYQELWGDCNGHTLVTSEEVAEMSRVWDKPISVLMEQLTVAHPTRTLDDDWNDF